MVDYGIGGFYAERAREVNGPGYDDLKFGSETVADPSQDGFGVGRKDEGVKGGVFLNCNIASLTRRFSKYSTRSSSIGFSKKAMTGITASSGKSEDWVSAESLIANLD
jgi:hypothetical protein